MPKYIKAESLIENMVESCVPIKEPNITGVTGDNSCILDYINDEPAADVQEVKHAENLAYTTDFFICSNCTIRIEDFTVGQVDEELNDVYYYQYNFIYYQECGAKILEG